MICVPSAKQPERNWSCADCKSTGDCEETLTMPFFSSILDRKVVIWEKASRRNCLRHRNKTEHFVNQKVKTHRHKHESVVYLSSMLLLHYCKSYGFWVCQTAHLSTRERRGGGRNLSQASTDKLERLVQDGQSVVAAVGRGSGWAYTLPQAIPGIFHDAKWAQR